MILALLLLLLLLLLLHIKVSILSGKLIFLTML